MYVMHMLFSLIAYQAREKKISHTLGWECMMRDRP